MIKTARVKLRLRRERTQLDRALRNAPPSMRAELWAMSCR
jgi:hypothetical protein